MSDPSKNSMHKTLLAPSSEVTSSEQLAATALVAGRYELRGMLGSGGMGTVYKAYDRELAELVAMKMLCPQFLKDAKMLERFRREVKLARRITHRNVARSFDIGEHDGQRFLTMELLEGEPLSQRLTKGKRLQTKEIVAIVEAICDGLEAAHSAGVIHRDLKPENVMLTTDGRVVIMDFGIARGHLAEDVSHATQGMPVGTPAYMAPEQLDGSLQVSQRADIYALGIMLYEMYTGELPWKGTNPFSVAAARLSQPPPDPRKSAPHLCEQGASLIQGCMARDPNQRLPDVKQLKARLSELNCETHPQLPQATKRSSALVAAQTEPQMDDLSKVAVLPFRVARDPDLEYLADGLAEDVIDCLSMINHLRVRPWGSVVKQRSAQLTAQEMGSELGVDAVVSGSLRKRRGNLHLSVRLLGVRDGFQIWAQRFDTTADDLIDIAEEVAQAVAKAVAANSPRPTPQFERKAMLPAAREHYLRGRHAYHQLDSASVSQALEHFENALTLSPNDPQILVSHALAACRLWFFGGMGAGAAARSSAERAVTVAPQQVESHLAQATVCYHENRLKDGILALRRGLALSPANADCHELVGRILSETGPTELSVGHLNRAAQLDPSLITAVRNAARVRALQGQTDEALDMIRQTMRTGNVESGWIHLARIINWTQDKGRAQEMLDDPTFSKDQHPIAARMCEHVLDGSVKVGIEEFFTPAMGSSHASRRSAVFILQMQVEYTCLSGNDVDKAASALQRAIQGGLTDLTWLTLCPALDALRPRPEYEAAVLALRARSDEVQTALTAPLDG